MLRKLGFMLAAALLAAGPAAAQDKPVTLNIGGGYTGVYGDGADHVGSGGNFVLGVTMRTGSAFGIQGEYGWNGMKQKQLSLPVSGSPDGSGVPTDFFADANMQYGDINAVINPHTSGKAAPYFLAGVGVYYRPVSISTPSVGFATVCDPYWYVCYPAAVPVEKIVGKRSSTDFGMNFGGGMNFKMTDNTALYFEVRYHYIWGPSVDPQVNPLATSQGLKGANGQFLPITVGFRF